MIAPRTPLSMIAIFSLDGRIFRAFDHLIAAGLGEALFVPQHLADGDLRGVVDYCPIPWEEAWMVLDTPLADGLPVDFASTRNHWPRLAKLHETGWQFDQIGVGNSDRQQKSIDRMTHISGLRFVRIRSANHG